jgi:hypothetical protein
MEIVRGENGRAYKQGGPKKQDPPYDCLCANAA